MRTLIRGGTAIDTDPISVTAADVLVEDGRIAAVGPDLAVPDGTTTIDASGMLVLPGFVDTHRHTWQAGIRTTGADVDFAGYLDLVLNRLAPRYRPDDVYAGTLAGALECLDAGITTLVDWSHIQHTPDHTAAAVTALRDSGVRAVFGYCSAEPDARVLAAQPIGGLVTAAMAPFGPEIVGEEAALAEWRVARELDLPVTVHMGGNGTESAERGLEFLKRHGLFGPRTMYVHGNHFTDDALRRIADSGGTISASPVVEVALGFGTPITGRALAVGVPTGLGADTVVSGPGDMFSLMRATHGHELSTRDALRAATVDGARVAGLDVGTLGVGRPADLVLLRTDLLGMAPATDPIGTIVLSADTRAVDTVLVAGQVVKRHGTLTRHTVSAVLATLAESTARILS
jgi:cytosine/adenosine deaminase-related metal-dependent hydrolase